MALGTFAQQAREGSEVQATLTPREHQILLMVSQGFTMQQAGHRLGISPRTVETHVSNIIRKLGTISVRNAAYNGSLGANASTSFGFLVNGSSSAPPGRRCAAA